jgi:hypothetical protein
VKKALELTRQIKNEKWVNVKKCFTIKQLKGVFYDKIRHVQDGNPGQCPEWNTGS